MKKKLSNTLSLKQLWHAKTTNLRFSTITISTHAYENWISVLLKSILDLYR